MIGLDGECTMLDDRALAMGVEEPLLEIILHSAEVGPHVNDFQPLRLLTNRGTIEGRLYPISRGTRAVVLAGDADGGWHGPALGLYPRLGRNLRQHSVPALHVCFREPAVLEECVLDVLSAVGYLESEGIRSMALVGHGIGGAAILCATAATGSAHAVVTLATGIESTGTVEHMPLDCPILAIHGAMDTRAAPAFPWDLQGVASDSRRIVVYLQAGHRLDEAADQVHDLVLAWILRHLKQPRDDNRGAP
jgi:hypothetical protein